MSIFRQTTWKFSLVDWTTPRRVTPGEKEGEDDDAGGLLETTVTTTPASAPAPAPRRGKTAEEKLAFFKGKHARQAALIRELQAELADGIVEKEKLLSRIRDVSWQRDKFKKRNEYLERADGKLRDKVRRLEAEVAMLNVYPVLPIKKKEKKKNTARSPEEEDDDDDDEDDAYAVPAVSSPTGSPSAMRRALAKKRRRERGDDNATEYTLRHGVKAGGRKLRLFLQALCGSDTATLKLPWFALEELTPEIAEQVFTYLPSEIQTFMFQTSLPLLPEMYGKRVRLLRTLDLHGCANLVELPESMASLLRLTTLNLSKCGELKSLPERFLELVTLRNLDLRGCRSLVFLPDELGAELPELETLRLRGCTGLVRLPETIGKLVKLQMLQLGDCVGLLALPPTIVDLAPPEKKRRRGRVAVAEEAATQPIELKLLDLKGCVALPRAPTLVIVERFRMEGSGCTVLVDEAELREVEL